MSNEIKRIGVGARLYEASSYNGIVWLAGQIGNPGQANYSASKAGLIGMTRTVAKELAGRKITVNAVAPGLVLPPDDLSDEAIERFLCDVPLGRSGTPLDVTQAIHFLVDAPYVTGVVLPVDGGRHLRR